MDLFPDWHHVRLRSRVHGTYLHADEDGHGISLSSRRASMSAAWVVHRYYANHYQVLLYSAAYGSYLSATNALAPIGCLGFRVAQRDYNELDEEAIRWNPVRTNNGVMLRLVVHGVYYYLRGNGKLLRGNGMVASVGFDNVTGLREWVVEPIPSRERMPRLPLPTRLQLPFLLTSRVMLFMRNGGEGCDANNVSFNFKGRSVFCLRNELINRLGISPDVSDNVVMYVRAGIHGRFTPLVVDLPDSTQTLVITAQTAPADLSAPGDVGKRLLDTLKLGGAEPYNVAPYHFGHPPAPFQALPPPPTHLPHLIKQSNVKTQMCRHWVAGSCWMEEQCNFAHGVAELRAVNRPLNYRTVRCRNWPLCPYGSQCQFKHCVEKDQRAGLLTVALQFTSS